MQTAYNILVALAELDAQIAILTNIQARTQEAKSLVLGKKVHVQERLKQLLTEHHALQRTLASQELETESLRVQQSAKQKQLYTIASARELTAAQAEIAALAEKIDSLEDSSLALLQALEEAAQRLAVFEEEARAELAAFEKELALLQVALADTDVRKQELLAQHANLIVQLPLEAQDRYRAMKESVENPIVKVEQGVCRGCFYSVTASEAALLRRHLFTQCPSCYRLLYGD
jgi:predicted  nucleic acid-binding Zn-ribbon protein